MTKLRYASSRQFKCTIRLLNLSSATLIGAVVVVGGVVGGVVGRVVVVGGVVVRGIVVVGGIAVVVGGVVAVVGGVVVVRSVIVGGGVVVAKDTVLLKTSLSVNDLKPKRKGSTLHTLTCFSCPPYGMNAPLEDTPR